MDKVNVTGLKALRNEMITFVKGEVNRKRAGHVGIAADDYDDDGDDPLSASQAVGVAHTDDDARGTPQGEPGADVDMMDEGAGRAVTGTAEEHQDDNGDREEEADDEGQEYEEEEEEEEEEKEEEEEEDDDDDDDDKEEDEEEAAVVVEAEKQQEGEEEEVVELEIMEEVVECDDGAEKTGGRTADEDAADDACVGAAPGRSEKVVVGDVAGVMAGVGGDTAPATTRTGMDGPTEAKAMGGWSRKKKAARGHPGPAASGRQAPVDVVELLRAENTRLRADNARLQESLNDQTGRVDILAKAVAGLLDKLTALTAQVATTDQKAAKRIEDATLAMSTTIADEITDNIADAIDATKSVSRFVVDWLNEISGPQGTMAVERAAAVNCVVDHQTAVWKGLEETIISYIGAAQTNIAAAVSRPIVLPTPPPPPPTPTQAIPEEFLLSFKADVLKAVTEVTQQSFVASGMKALTEMIGNAAPGGGGDGGDSGSTKRSKGGDGSRGVGAVGPGGSRTQGQSVVDQLKKKGAEVIRLHRKGDGICSADGGPADGVAAPNAVPTAPPLVPDQETPTSHAAGDGGAGAVKGPSVGVAGTTSTPIDPPGASRAPVGQSADNKVGPEIAPTPAPADRTAATGDAKGAAANRDASAARKSDALRELLHRMETHRKDVQQPPSVDAAPLETARPSVAPQVAAAASNAPPTAPQVAARPPADPKSALLRARLGARSAAAPTRTRPAAGSGAKQTSAGVADPTPGGAIVDAAAEKGVSAALATGGRGGDPAQAAKGHNDADIAAIHSLLEALHCPPPPPPPALAIADTAHVGTAACPPGGSAVPKTSSGTVGVGKAKRNGKADTRTGRAISQRITRANSAAEQNQEEKSVGEGTSAKQGKEKAAVGDGRPVKKGKEKEKKKEQAEKEAEEKEKGRKGHGIRQDSTGDGLGWVGEIKVLNHNRYIGKSRVKMELAYLHSIAFMVYDGYVSKVLMDELTGLKDAEMEEWRRVWEEVRILPTGMWTVIWARGAYLPRTRFDGILDKYRAYKSSGDAHHNALLPAIWFPVDADTKEGQEKADAAMSALISRVSMCAAYGKVAASVVEKTELVAQAWAASASALWCLVENDDASVDDAVREGMAAAMVVGASETTEDVFKKVMKAVIQAEIEREQPLGEVAHNVAPALQSAALQKLYPGRDAEHEAVVVARAMVETMAFWGMCPVAGPKLEEIGIAVPCDAQMEHDFKERGKKGQRGKQGKDSTEKTKGKKGRKVKDNTDA
ncbi:unnamed protein product [Closterium sp. NIES-65]|nr:unnamed protein product [Closterium sp. NIES-65]